MDKTAKLVVFKVMFCSLLTGFGPDGVKNGAASLPCFLEEVSPLC
uniref:Uncharacterized protein n=1 Tax=Arundo donax TaxID=35708 RepID=A0A0A8ZU42_ARUDO